MGKGDRARQGRKAKTSEKKARTSLSERADGWNV